MEFSEFINILFDLQKRFPGMRYTVNDGQVAIYLETSKENTDLIRQGQELFA